MPSSTPDRAARAAWEREYAEVHAYTTSYRDDLDRGIQYLLGYLQARGEHIDGPVLECACGRGRNAMPLLAAGYRVVGLDHARTALAEFRRRIVAADAEAAAVGLQHDLRQALPAADEAFGLVIDVTAIDNLVEPGDQVRYGREVARVLRPGGLALVVTFDRDDGYYAPFLNASPRGAQGVVLDPHTGVSNQLFRGAQLDALFCPPLRREAANRFDFIDAAGRGTWTRRFLLRLYRKP